MMLKSLVVLILILCSGFSYAEEEDNWDGQGEISLEYRTFKDDNDFATEDTGVSIFSQVESRYETEQYNFLARISGRTDSKDDSRSFVSIDDLNASATFGDAPYFKFLAGYKTFSWTATEAFHPADVINSRNYDSNLESLEKRGELTLELEMEFYDGIFQLFYWPRFEEPDFPGARSRLGSKVDLDRPVVVDGDDTSTNSRWVNQYGFQVSQTFGSLDTTFHYIKHVDRNFPLIGGTYTKVSFAGNESIVPNKLTLTPFYFDVIQWGGTMQYVLEGVITKLEFAYRDFAKYNDFIYNAVTGEFLGAVDHGEVALGFEYSYNHDNGFDSMFLLEATTILDTTETERQRLSVFQRDAMVGYRLTLNDVMGTEFFMSTIFDLERDSERLYNFNAARRITDVWKVTAAARIYDAPQKGSSPVGLENYHEDNSFSLKLSRFF
jgi:hypothetical protein